jgi:hypothetical protein
MRKVMMGSWVLATVIAGVVSTPAFADGDANGKRPLIQLADGDANGKRPLIQLADGDANGKRPLIQLA